MVTIDNLVKHYDGFELNISLEIKPGCVTGIVGRNGAGKSTTIKSIIGLVEPDSGSVTVFGKEAKKLLPKDKEMLGVALSDSGFSSYLCVKDVLAILRNMYTNFDETLFRELCARYELPLNKRLKDFSTGMNAKLKVLVAMAHKPKLLILDEPTSGLDVIARNEVLDMLRAYLEQDPNRAMLISSHISGDLEGMCDDIYMIHEGKVILHEDTDVILGDYALLKVSESQYERMDKQYLLKTIKESYGYACFTANKRFYMENYPDLVMEGGNIDDLIIMMTGGK